MPQGKGNADLWRRRAWIADRYAEATSSETSEASPSKNTNTIYDDKTEEVPHAEADEVERLAELARELEREGEA